MSVFKYDAMDQSGEKVHSTIEAIDSKGALVSIRNLGLFPTRICPMEDVISSKSKTSLASGLSRALNDFGTGYQSAGTKSGPLAGSYYGIGYPRIFGWLWGEWLCRRGRHLLDEVVSHTGQEKVHYLHCDCCGLEIHISRIVSQAEAIDEIHA